MHWWQGRFSSSSKPQADDDIITGDGASSRKTGFFSSRWNRNFLLRRKLMQVTKTDVDAWRSHSHSEAESKSALVSPQPLPLPELCLPQRDPKSSSNVPLPSPNKRGAGEKERERGKIEGLCAGGIHCRKSKLVGENTQPSVEQSDFQLFIKSQIKQNTKERLSCSHNNTNPVSSPTSPHSSPVLSPRRSDVQANSYTTPPGVFHVWSAPEMPQSDGNMRLSFDFQMPSEKTTRSVDNSPLHSPRASSRLPFASPPKPSLPSKISSETPAARRDSNCQATVHPLPLPPGAGMASQPSIASTSDFSTKLEFSGAKFPAQTCPNPNTAGKTESNPVKSQWQKGKLIGRGTFGSVYVASNRETGALCAMKEVEILPDDLKSTESLRQLQQEIKVLSNLRHPNIVQYYGSEIVGDKFYIYLEYVHPGSINKFIQDHCGAITESVVRNFTRHILCGLSYLHSTKTIHRDIKGANLLVDGYGVVKLADFGMAKHLNGQVANLSLKGSPYWLAPELLQPVMTRDASADLALAVDIWSLGCTIIEMMNGKPPWSEYEGAAALFKVLQETPPIPETVSADGKDFLECCFRRNPADRPTASQLLDHPFVNSSPHPDASTQSIKQMRLTDAMQFRRELSCNDFGQVPTLLDKQIKKGKLASK